MAKQILVLITKNDRVEEIIPYVERVAHPGMKVVFLLRYPVDGFDGYIRAGMATGETGIPNPEEVKKIGERYSMDSQQQMARQKVFPACNSLQEKGAEVAVDVYTGSLKKALRNYTIKGDVHLIMQRAGIGFQILRFLQGTVAVFGLVKRLRSAPLILVHPGTSL